MIGKITATEFNPQVGEQVKVRPHYFIRVTTPKGRVLEDDSNLDFTPAILGIARFISTRGNPNNPKKCTRLYSVQLLEDSDHPGWRQGDTVKVGMNQLDPP